MKQPTVSLSSTEAEYKGLSDACKDVIWLRSLQTEVLVEQSLDSTSIFIDNRGAIDLALSQVSQNGFRTKHMDLRLHFVRDLIRDKSVTIKFIGTQHNIADFLTKPVGRSKILRTLKTICTMTPVVSASSIDAQSTAACQNTDSAPADEFIQAIHDELGKSQYDYNSHDRDTVTDPDSHSGQGHNDEGN